MKKITLLMAAFLMALGMNAQLFFDDFEGGDIDSWTQIDADGDGNTFFHYDLPANENAMMTSASWIASEGALTPNNYSVSPAINVTGAVGLMLSYKVGGQDPAWFAENYTVYVSTGNTIAAFDNASLTVSFSENIGSDAGAAGNLVQRTLDVSTLDGATTVYIAFRHHGVTDQFFINFDDIQLDSNLSIPDNNINGFNYYYNPQAQNLTISAFDNFSNISIFNVLGQQVINKNLSSTNEVINLSSIKTGVYIVNVVANGQTTTFKLAKR